MNIQRMQKRMFHLILIVSLLCGLFCTPVIENEDWVVKGKANSVSVIHAQERSPMQPAFVEETLSATSQLALFKSVSERKTETNKVQVMVAALVQIYLAAFVCFLTSLFKKRTTVGSQHFIIRFIHEKDGQKA